MEFSRFDANIITAAIRLHDPRTTAHLDSNETTLRYSETALVKYQNVAIRDTIKDVYLNHTPDFDSIMPEMTSESADIAVNSGIIIVPSDCWIVLECAKSDYTWYARRIARNTMKVKAGRDALLIASASKPLFYQTGRTVVVLPLTITSVNARLWYIQQPSDMTAGNATDIPISPMWDGEIVERMVAMGTADAKSSIAQ
jgi:hypothetical protein